MAALAPLSKASDPLDLMIAAVVLPSGSPIVKLPKVTAISRVKFLVPPVRLAVRAADEVVPLAMVFETQLEAVAQLPPATLLHVPFVWANPFKDPAMRARTKTNKTRERAGSGVNREFSIGLRS